MSRSYKKAIVKDGSGDKSWYHKTIRRENKQVLQEFVSKNIKGRDFSMYWDEPELPVYSEEVEKLSKSKKLSEDEVIRFAIVLSGIDYFKEPEFRNPRSIINDWDYCDYICDYEYTLRYQYYYNLKTRSYNTEKHEATVRKYKRK